MRKCNTAGYIAQPLWRHDQPVYFDVQRALTAANTDYSWAMCKRPDNAAAHLHHKLHALGFAEGHDGVSDCSTQHPLQWHRVLAHHRDTNALTYHSSDTGAPNQQRVALVQRQSGQ